MYGKKKNSSLSKSSSAPYSNDSGMPLRGKKKGDAPFTYHGSAAASGNGGGAGFSKPFNASKVKNSNRSF